MFSSLSRTVQNLIQGAYSARFSKLPGRRGISPINTLKGPATHASASYRTQTGM